MNETIWLNVDSPLRLADLRGKVMALEMWTFSCINCQHVIPALKQFEEDLTNLQNAIAENQIQYAVTQDNDGATWKAYKNRYWPTLYLSIKKDTCATPISVKVGIKKQKRPFKFY